MANNFDDWMQRANGANQRGDSEELRYLFDHRPHPTIERATVPKDGDIQVPCIFCQLFAELSGAAEWNGSCPVCGGVRSVSIATYFVMLDAYMEDLTLAEREQVLADEASEFTIPLMEVPAQPPTPCPNPNCQQGSVLTDGKDHKGDPALVWVNCATCHGKGYLGVHPTAERTLRALPCVYCMHDVDDVGGDFQSRKERCIVCRGTGAKSKAFYRSLLLAFQEAPTRVPSGKPNDPLTIRGTLTLREALDLQHGAVTTLNNRPARIYVCRTENNRLYRVLGESVSATLGQQKFVIFRDRPFRQVERYLAEEVKHIDPRGWRAFDPAAAGGLR